MKKSIFCIALLMSSFLFVSAKKAQALPFKENCASMQAYFNGGKWDNPDSKTTFSGFENNKIVIMGEWGDLYPSKYSTIMCESGYITETSQMGTRVCHAWLIYRTGPVEDVIYKLEWRPYVCNWK